MKNLFDEFAESGAAGTALSNAVFTDENAGPVYTRAFYCDVLPTRSIGVKMSYKIGAGR